MIKSGAFWPLPRVRAAVRHNFELSLALLLGCSGQDVMLGQGAAAQGGGIGGTSSGQRGQSCGGEAAEGGYFKGGGMPWDGSAGNAYGYPPEYQPAQECNGIGFHDTCDFWEICTSPCQDARECPSVDGGPAPECRNGTCVLPCAGGAGCPQGMRCIDHPYGLGEICMWRNAVEIPEDQFLERLAAAFCDNVAGCCAEVGVYDRARCAAALAASYDEAYPPELRGQLEYRPSVAGECVAVTREAARACEYLPGLRNCADVFAGTTPPGAACKIDSECAAPRSGSASCDSTCVIQLRGAAGDACRETCTEGPGFLDCSGVSGAPSAGATCYTNDGLYCSGGTCQAQRALGEACSSSGACFGEAYCDGGSCLPKAELGGACTAYDGCKEDAYCEPLIGSCQPRKPDGAACRDAIDECRGRCEAGVCTEEYRWPGATACGGPA